MYNKSRKRNDKTIYAIGVVWMFVLGIHAQKSEYVVRSFATNMQSWGQTSKLEYQRNLQKLCNGAKSVRVADEIVESLAAKMAILVLVAHTF